MIRNRIAQAFVVSTIALALLAGCVTPTPQVIVVTATAEPTLVATATRRPTDRPRPTSTPSYIEPKVSDFSIELVVIEKQCFGSAGCSVTVEPSLSCQNVNDCQLDPTKEYLLVYELTGDEDGIMTSNITLRGETYSYYEVRLSTASSSVEIAASVVTVLSRP